MSISKRTSFPLQWPEGWKEVHPDKGGDNNAAAELNAALAEAERELST